MAEEKPGHKLREREKEYDIEPQYTPEVPRGSIHSPAVGEQCDGPESEESPTSLYPGIIDSGEGGRAGGRLWRRLRIAWDCDREWIVGAIGFVAHASGLPDQRRFSGFKLRGIDQPGTLSVQHYGSCGSKRRQSDQLHVQRSVDSFRRDDYGAVGIACRFETLLSCALAA